VSDSVDANLHWRVADAMEASPLWVPEMAWHATGEPGVRFDPQLEFFLQHGIEDDVWRAHWMTKVAPRARLGDESRKQVLQSHKFRATARVPGAERLRLFERSTRRVRSALSALRWIAEAAYWRGEAPPAPSLVPLLSADASPTPVESFWLMSDTMRRIGARPYTAVYVRRSLIDTGAMRGWIEHNVCVKPEARAWFGWPVVEEVSCALQTELVARGVDHPELARLTRALHRLGFHGRSITWDPEHRRFGGTFHGPHRPLREYYSTGSAFFRIGPKLDRVARGPGA
jgi:hypothetical protein